MYGKRTVISTLWSTHLANDKVLTGKWRVNSERFHSFFLVKHSIMYHSRNRFKTFHENVEKNPDWTVEHVSVLLELTPNKQNYHLPSYRPILDKISSFCIVCHDHLYHHNRLPF